MSERPAQDDLLSLLPEGWRAPEPAALDLESELGRGARPPLPQPDASFGLIWAGDVFTRLASGWAELLLEIRRLLLPQGVAIVELAPPEAFEKLSGESWVDDRIGLSVVPAPGGEVRVFHSEWWLRSRWGRAFELSRAPSEDGERRLLLRRRDGTVTAERLREPEPGEPREAASACAEIERLHHLWDSVDRGHRRELEEQREEFGRELMRRSFRAADSELGWDDESPGALTAARYEATVSWRVTRPLRAAGRVIRRLR